MSFWEGAERPPVRRGLNRITPIFTLALIALARGVCRLPPHRIETLMRVASRGARPATYAQAERGLEAVLTASKRMRGPHSCLPRSVAAAWVCRLYGVWPTWCTGVRVAPPFGAHAWLVAEDRLVREPADADAYAVLLQVVPYTGDASAAVN